MIKLIGAFTLLIGILIAIMRMYTVLPARMSPAEYCGMDKTSSSQVEDAARFTVEVWAKAHGVECWRAFSIVKAAEQVSERIHVKVQAFETQGGPYQRALVAASEAGVAPDISIASEPRLLVEWADAGYISPLNECINRHDEFTNIRDELWSKYVWQGKTWGIPVEADLYGLYYNKEKLRALGWTEEDIAEFPRQIQNGTFTLNTLIRVANQSIQTGVVKSGHGFWPSLRTGDTLSMIYLAHGGVIDWDLDWNQKKERNALSVLVIDQDLLAQTYAFWVNLFDEQITLNAFKQAGISSWFNENASSDAVSQGEVLFWIDKSIRWVQDYAHSFANHEEMSEQIGLALIPRHSTGDKAIAWVLSVRFYLLASERASGRSRQDIGCDILAQVVQPEIHALHITKASQLGVIKSMATHPAFAYNKFIAEKEYMWEYAQNSTLYSPLRGAYNNILIEFADKVENGVMTPDVAALAAVQKLRRELGDALVLHSELPKTLLVD